jgi:hypothetical protein
MKQLKSKFIFILFILLLPISAFAENNRNNEMPENKTKTIYDKDYHRKGYIEKGKEYNTIYDKNWNRKGYYKDGQMYDKNWNRKGRIR